MIFDDVLRNRRSIRQFKREELPMQSVFQIVDAARITPSAKNRQPWFFEVLTGKNKQSFIQDYYQAADVITKDLDATGIAMQSAPVIIAVYNQGSVQTDVLSVGAAMYAMCLKATDLSLGSLWIGDTDCMISSEKYKALAGAVAVGYADERPAARLRKAIEEISNLTQINVQDPSEDDMMNPDLAKTDYAFISYSHADREVVIKDIVELKHHGIPLWYDKALKYGDYWDDSALEVIGKENCKCFILYVSYNSLISDNVFKEFSEATNKMSCKIIPILIGRVTARELIQKMREHGFEKKAASYEKYFGKDENMLYLSRSAFPGHLDHFQSLISAVSESGVCEGHAAYDHFSYRIVKNECVITGYTGTGDTLYIPESISGYPVTTIGESAFAGNSSIKKVILPSSVRRLCLGAFRETGINRIELPSTVIEVQTACFRDCKYLEYASFPDGIAYLAEALFRGCEQLKRFVAPSTVERMEEAVFRNCSSLEEVVLPDSLQSMTEGGFYGCRSLRRLIIPCTVVGAEIQSFDTCPLLERVQIGKFVFEHGTARKV
ncbi:MAG: leucine-rich repeat protein [Clostridia bacterium]|nr:leucine-rich repeat protein [Clostridia bacterium]